jgi:hypothetical protein
VKNISRFPASAALVVVFCALGGTARADSITLGWPQPDGPGTAVRVTYSYSNLLDGTLFLLTPAQLRSATEEALGLWAQSAPLHFIEAPDSGPPPSDNSYPGDTHPQVRIGHHPMSELAHGYDPGDGLGGDVHFDSGIPWSVGTGHWNFLEAVTHELGHALGLDHEVGQPAIMNAFYPQRRFTHLGSAYLLPADVESLRALYGTGIGSVQPLQPTPEPTVFLPLTVVLALVARARRRERWRRAHPVSVDQKANYL